MLVFHQLHKFVIDPQGYGATITTSVKAISTKWTGKGWCCRSHRKSKSWKKLNITPWWWANAFQEILSEPILNGLVCVFSLGPSDTKWSHRSEWILAHVMACCLTTPSHYMDQCWLIITQVQCHSSEENILKRCLSQEWLKSPATHPKQ